MPPETRRQVSAAVPGAETRDTPPCSQCGEPVRPGERGPLPTYCGDCRELRHTVNRLQGILKRRPDLREVMERELCVRVSKAPQSGPRPAYRERRIELHVSDWVRMTLKRLKYETGRTLSDIAEDALRVGLGYPVVPEKPDWSSLVGKTLRPAEGDGNA